MSSFDFDYSLDFEHTDFRAHPELYRVGKGEQGVLSVQPYKGEILPHWRFKTPELAAESSDKIYEMFLDYKRQGDFVGMDMARKFLQMGWTRARRYANHKSGRKYSSEGEALPREVDEVKAQSAAIFYAKYQQAKSDPEYLAIMKAHKEKYEKYERL